MLQEFSSHLIKVQIVFLLLSCNNNPALIVAATCNIFTLSALRDETFYATRHRNDATMKALCVFRTEICDLCSKSAASLDKRNPLWLIDKHLFVRYDQYISNFQTPEVGSSGFTFSCLTVMSLVF